MSVVSYLYKTLFGPEAKNKMASVVYGPDPTDEYRVPRHDFQELLIDEIPLFTVWMARLMLHDPAIQIGLATRNAALSVAEVEVKSKSAEIANYVRELHHRTYAKFGSQIRGTKAFGFKGLQFTYEKSADDNCIYPVDCKSFTPHDVRCLTSRGKTVGFTVKHVGHPDGAQNAPVLPPRGAWLVYDREYSPYYGQSLLRQSYGAWYEKWMKHGAKRTTQLRFMKDAWIGDSATYPLGRNIQLPNGQVVSYRDVIRESLENRLSGGTVLMPSLLDANGKPLIEYKPPQDTGSPTGILQWVEYLDVDIWRGMVVFEEVIRASSSGSGFSGRSVPFLMFLSSVNDEWQELLHQIDMQIYRPLVWYQFGASANYSISAVPLANTFVNDIAGSSVGGASMGGGHGDRAFPGDDKMEAEGVPNGTPQETP